MDSEIQIVEGPLAQGVAATIYQITLPHGLLITNAAAWGTEAASGGDDVVVAHSGKILSPA